MILIAISMLTWIFPFQEMEPEVVENYAMHVNRLVKSYILLRNQRSGKQIAKKAGDFGVLEPVTREHYLKFFSDFDLIGVDSKTFGEESWDITLLLP
ncbi:hypothetical protein KAI46_03515 [bacterium]|nr:hypothetical protein [bacterium]